MGIAPLFLMVVYVYKVGKELSFQGTLIVVFFILRYLRYRFVPNWLFCSGTDVRRATPEECDTAQNIHVKLSIAVKRNLLSTVVSQLMSSYGLRLMVNIGITINGSDDFGSFLFFVQNHNLMVADFG